MRRIRLRSKATAQTKPGTSLGDLNLRCQTSPTKTPVPARPALTRGAAASRRPDPTAARGLAPLAAHLVVPVSFDDAGVSTGKKISFPFFLFSNQIRFYPLP